MLKTDVTVEKKVDTYNLSLTADELTWLLLEVFPAAARNAEPSFAIEIKSAGSAWWDEVNKQGWVPF